MTMVLLRIGITHWINVLAMFVMITSGLAHLQRVAAVRRLLGRPRLQLVQRQLTDFEPIHRP
jgi:Ni,Fe-hydrogenase I cytochrome b subunit